MIKGFLPITKEDMAERGIEQLDFVYVIGDAYVDHPSFGPAIISRILEANGYTVGIISQPNWKDKNSITILGEPRLGFLVCGGNMDTMVNHYTVAKKKRSIDNYTPGGEMGKRPDRASIVYSKLIRQTYKEKAIVIGGIEASLRRLAHYDYWSDSVMKSMLIDSGADLLSYGMGERSIVEIADALNSGIEAKYISFIEGTVYKTTDISGIYDYIKLPSYEEITANKRTFAESFYTQYCNTDPFASKILVEPYANGEFVVQNTPSKPLTQAEMDRVYALPYMRAYHPSYEALGGIPALNDLKFSLINNRGCFGGCNFCALTFHQGRIIQTRSHESIMDEANLMLEDKDFKGNIFDVGGPTANFRHQACEKQSTHGACVNKQCLWPKPCKNLKIDHSDFSKLLKDLRELPGVKKVFIRSGIRFDYLVNDPNDTFIEELCEHHVSGQLKVAPEHISDTVLDLMGKPENSVYERFMKKYKQVNVKLNKKQYVVPYLMSSHPGSSLKEAIELAEYIRDLGYMPEQVQDFYPTPSTMSTCMYYTELDPRTMKKVYVPKTPHEKAMQRALIQYRNPKNYDLIIEALVEAGRTDLIGFEKHCLVRPAYKDKDRFGTKRNPKTGNSQTGNSKTGNSKTGNSKSNGKPGTKPSKTGFGPGKKEQASNTQGGKKKKAIRNVHKAKKK